MDWTRATLLGVMARRDVDEVFGKRAMGYDRFVVAEEVGDGVQEGAVVEARSLYERLRDGEDARRRDGEEDEASAVLPKGLEDDEVEFLRRVRVEEAEAEVVSRREEDREVAEMMRARANVDGAQVGLVLPVRRDRRQSNRPSLLRTTKIIVKKETRKASSLVSYEGSSSSSASSTSGR